MILATLYCLFFLILNIILQLQGRFAIDSDDVDIVLDDDDADDEDNVPDQGQAKILPELPGEAAELLICEASVGAEPEMETRKQQMLTPEEDITVKALEM